MRKKETEFWKKRLAFFYECFKKDTFKTINGVQFFSIQWLKKYRKKNSKLVGEPESTEFITGYNTALMNLLSTARKEAKKK